MRPVGIAQAACAGVRFAAHPARRGSSANRPNWLPFIPALTVGPELVRRTVEITRKVLDSSQVGARGTFSVIATRDFIERQLSKMGHKDLLVTHIYRRTIPNARGGAREASAVRLSSSGVLFH